jgi:hypothetical protein
MKSTDNQKIIDRIQLFIDAKNITNKEFEVGIDVTIGLINKTIKNRGSISSDKLWNIFQKYPELNRDWLMSGLGDMLQSENKAGYDIIMYLNPKEIGTNNDKQPIVLPMKALAGNEVIQWDAAVREAHLIPGLSFRLQIIIDVVGDSMQPVIEQGDKVLITPVMPDEVISGKIYVMHTPNGETLIKKVVVDPKQKIYMLISENPYYTPMAKSEGDIHAFYRVIGKVNLL